MHEHGQGRQKFVALRKLSRKLQNRLAGIIMHLDFIVGEKAWRKQLLYYQNNKLSKIAPQDFIT